MNGKFTDAAPMAWLIYWSSTELGAPELTRNAGRVTEIMALDKPPRVEPLYTHLQPAKPEAVRLRDELWERAEFEAWAEPKYQLLRMDDGYRSTLTEYAWTAWQACLAATGKQQVGEVQGDGEAKDRLITKLRGMMDHSCGVGGAVVYGTKEAVAEIEKRLAARHPVGDSQ